MFQVSFIFSQNEDQDLLSKLILLSGGSQAKYACGIINFSIGIKKGIEEDIHTVIDRMELDRGDWGVEENVASLG